MKCPDCQAETRVTETRHSGPNLRRRRHCMACGKRLTTIEVAVVEGTRNTDGHVMILPELVARGLREALDDLRDWLPDLVVDPQADVIRQRRSTAEHRDLVLQLAREGRAAGEIAQMVGRTPSGIRQMCERAGVRLLRRGQAPA